MKRWRDDPSHAPAAALALLPVATVTRALPAAAKARSRGAVIKLASHAPAASLFSSSAFKLAAGGMMAIAVTAGVHGATSSTNASEAVSAPQMTGAPSRASRVAAELSFVKNVPDLPREMPPRAPLPSPLVTEHEATLPVASEASTSTPSDEELRRELAMLEEARSALVSNPQAAFDLAFRHETLHPRGQMWAEREVIAVLALEQLDRCSLAAPRRAALLTRAPSYATRLRTSRCP